MILYSLLKDKMRIAEPDKEHLEAYRPTDLYHALLPWEREGGPIP